MAISGSTAMAIAAISSLAASGVAAYGAIQQQQVANDVAAREKKALEMQAALENENARMQAAELQTQAQRVASSQVVSGAGAGINLNSTSLFDLMEETAGLYELDRQQILRTGKLQSAATTYSAGSLGANKYGGYYQAAGSLLGGIGQSAYYGNKAGWFD